MGRDGTWESPADEDEEERDGGRPVLEIERCIGGDSAGCCSGRSGGGVLPFLGPTTGSSSIATTPSVSALASLPGYDACRAGGGGGGKDAGGYCLGRYGFGGSAAW